jgi:hypothetical protein
MSWPAAAAIAGATFSITTQAPNPAFAHSTHRHRGPGSCPSGNSKMISGRQERKELHRVGQRHSYRTQRQPVVAEPIVRYRVGLGDAAQAQ